MAAELVVLHYTAMQGAEAALHRLCDPDAEVSAHYLIAADGNVFQLVGEDCRAWHAGAGQWGGQGDVNSRSIGIELDNDGASPFAARLMDALEELLMQVMTRNGIQPEGVIAHSDMAPGRKSDPGPRFDWRRLALSGLAVWPQPAVVPAADFTASAHRFGYPDADPALLLDVFRQRFRPWARGPETPADRAAIADLAARFPVDRDPPST